MSSDQGAARRCSTLTKTSLTRCVPSQELGSGNGTDTDTLRYVLDGPANCTIAKCSSDCALPMYSYMYKCNN